MAARCLALCQMLGHREAQEITGNLSCVGRGDGAHKETLITAKALCISLIHGVDLFLQSLLGLWSGVST